MIPQEYIQEVVRRNDIEDIVGQYVQLRRRGRTLTGLCPFHNEKTPSFVVYPDTQSFYCFGCGAAGDVISFVRKYNNLGYVETVKQLASRAGMPLPEEDDKESRARQRLLEINRCAARYFYEQLNARTPEAALARRYWREKRGLSDAAYGLWAGTAVNDTSSVVAAGYAFSEQAGDFATMVKLTRTLAIIPTVLIFALIGMHVKKKEAAGAPSAVRVNMKSVFPWFILGFLAMAVLSSVGVIPAAAAAALKKVSKFLMVTALAAVGLNTSFAEMKKSGAAPMVHGFLISALVVLVALAVEYFMGILPF